MIDIAGMRSGWIVECYGEKWIVVAEHGAVYVAIRWTDDLPAQAFILHKAACSGPRLPTQDEKAEAERVQMTSTPLGAG